MKNYFLILILYSICANVFSQAPTLLWSKKIEGSSVSSIDKVINAKDNNYIIFGSAGCDNSPNYQDYKMDIIKTDRNGSILWSRCLGGSSDVARAIFNTDDSGFLILADTYTDGGDIIGLHGMHDIWLAKLDSLRNFQWRRCLGGSQMDYPYDMIKLSDGNYLIAAASKSTDGDTRFINKGLFDIWILKVDNLGNIIWQKNYGGTDDDYPNVLLETSNGDILIGGYSFSQNGDMYQRKYPYGQDCWFFRINNLGELIWSKAIGGSGFSETIKKIFHNNVDNTFTLIGYTESIDMDFISNPGSMSCFVTKIDGNGNILKTKIIGGTNYDIFLDAIQNDNGNVILALISNSEIIQSHGDFDTWIVKIDTELNIIWHKNYGGSNYDIGQTIILDSDKNIICGGKSLSIDYDLNGTNNIGQRWLYKIGRDNNCYGTLFLFSNIIHDSIYNSYQQIIINKPIESPYKLRLTAQEAISILPGFETKQFTNFSANIETCEN